MKYYMVTIKCNQGGFVSEGAILMKYYDLVKRIRGASWSSHPIFELDSQDRLHLHTWFTRKTPVYFKSYQIIGWSINFTEFPEADLDNIRNYINKTTHYITQPELKATSFARHMDFTISPSE